MLRQCAKQVATSGNQQHEGPTLALISPSGEKTQVLTAPAHPEAASYTPPSQDDIAKVVKECERNNSCKSEHGGNPVGALLRAASIKLGLYSDGGNPNKTFFTHGLLVEVLTKDRISSSLHLDSKEAKEECYRRILGSGKPNELGEYARIFAVLLLCNQPEDIFKFFNSESNMNDEAFPFKVGKLGDNIRSKSWGAEIPDFRPGWATILCESFVTQQWRVFLPCFKKTEEDQIFGADTIMPWYNYQVQARGSSNASTDGGVDAPGGGNSVVNRVYIHDGHWNFDGLNPVSGQTEALVEWHRSDSATYQTPENRRAVTFAVKRLITHKEKIFKQEVSMLRKLCGEKAHTVRLLAAFRHGGTYCLLFPWAECDLLTYWQRDSGLQNKRHQEESYPLIVWVARQCHGLLNAIHWIHVPSTVLDPNNEPLFGRHGDIKPENILWYKKNSDGPHPLASGELVLSDFGLTALHHDQSRSNVENGGIQFTKTYAPPESVLSDKKISRSIDIWSLGCVFLEFVTWLVGGPSHLAQFRKARTSPGLSSFSDDIFWEVQKLDDPTTGAQKHVTVVKPKVEEVGAL